MLITAEGVAIAEALMTQGFSMIKSAPLLVAAYAALEVARGFVNSYAVGAFNIPNDQTAKLHAGEMVIPKDWATAVRSGDISIGGGKGSNGNKIGVDVYVSNFRNAQRYGDYQLDRMRI
jgi:hypothetical protein